MPSIFSQIYSGQIPGFIIGETEHSFAFMNKFPTRPGHLLVVPKLEIPHLFDAPPEVYADLWQFSAKIAKALKKVSSSEKIGVAVEGFGIKDHCHIHLMPINTVGELQINSAAEASDEELSDWQAKLKMALEQ